MWSLNKGSKIAKDFSCEYEFEDGEVADDGKTYNYKFYGLKAVIAVGYKVNSQANAWSAFLFLPNPLQSVHAHNLLQMPSTC